MTAPRRRPLWVVGAALSIGAGVIHFAFGPEHVEELGLLGYSFYLSGALQVGWAAVLGFLLVRPRGEDATLLIRTLAVSGNAINARSSPHRSSHVCSTCLPARCPGRQKPSVARTP